LEVCLRARSHAFERSESDSELTGRILERQAPHRVITGGDGTSRDDGRITDVSTGGIVIGNLAKS
jgi:hypothetical protein